VQICYLVLVRIATRPSEALEGAPVCSMNISVERRLTEQCSALELWSNPFFHIFGYILTFPDRSRQERSSEYHIRGIITEFEIVQTIRAVGDGLMHHKVLPIFWTGFIKVRARQNKPCST